MELCYYRSDLSISNCCRWDCVRGAGNYIIYRRELDPQDW